MNRFTKFILRLALALLCIVIMGGALLIRWWQGATGADCFRVLAFGLATAWVVAPCAEDVAAFIALCRCDD